MVGLLLRVGEWFRAIEKFTYVPLASLPVIAMSSGSARGSVVTMVPSSVVKVTVGLTMRVVALRDENSPKMEMTPSRIWETGMVRIDAPDFAYLATQTRVRQEMYS